jgi:hypothetical protein
VLELKEVFVDKVKNDVGYEKVYSSRDCLVNPDYIVTVYPHEFSSSSDEKMLSNFHEKMDPVEFSRIVLDGNNFRTSEMIVLIPYEKLVGLLKS